MANKLPDSLSPSQVLRIDERRYRDGDHYRYDYFAWIEGTNDPRVLISECDLNERRVYEKLIGRYGGQQRVTWSHWSGRFEPSTLFHLYRNMMEGIGY